MNLFKKMILLNFLLSFIVINGYGQSAEYFFIEAEYYYYQGEKEEALKFYNQAIEKDSNLVIGYNNRGLLKQELGDYKGALADFNKIIALEPNNAIAYNNLAIVKIDQEDYIVALAMCKKALEIDSTLEMIVVYANRGRAKHELKQYKEAIKDYDYFAKYVPSDPEVYYRRGVSKCALGDTLGSILDYEKAIQRNRLYIPAYIEKGNIELDMGEDKAAIKTFSKIIKLSTDEFNIATAYGQRGVIWARLGKHKKALKDYNFSIAYDPKESFAYLSRAIVLLELKELDLALEDCNKALDLAPQFGDAYFIRATVYKNLGKLESACLDLTKAQKIGVEEAEIIYGEDCTGK